MYKDLRMQNLFEVNNDPESDNQSEHSENKPYKAEGDLRNKRKDTDQKEFVITENIKKRVVEKIVWFYDDNSFEEYYHCLLYTSVKEQSLFLYHAFLR